MAFTAKFTSGRCRRCDGPIVAGQSIMGTTRYQRGGGYRHTVCPVGVPAGEAPASDLDYAEADIADDRSSYGRWQTRRSANDEYRRGIAEGQEYSRNRKVFGDALAEQWEMEAEMARYNRGEDY